MDNLPAIVPPAERSMRSKTPRAPLIPKTASSETPPNPYGRTDGRTDGRRTITRYAFEIYQDQIETFRKFGLEDKMRGGKGSMSEMVREALDSYIAKKTDSSR